MSNDSAHGVHAIRFAIRMDNGMCHSPENAFDAGEHFTQLGFVPNMDLLRCRCLTN